MVGETHHLRFITSTGVTVDETVEIAVTSPRPSWNRFWHYGLLGICVGFAPIALGMLFFPVVRNLRESGLEFVLAMTIGMLTYLFVDLMLRGLEVAGEASSVFQGGMMIWFPMALTFGALATLASQKQSRPGGLRTAVLVAIGIGFTASILGVATSRHVLTVYGVPLSTAGIVVCWLVLFFALAWIGAPERGIIAQWRLRKKLKMETKS